jgi:hypothetical protein
MAGNDRWARDMRPGDLTGNIGKELAKKAKAEQEKKLAAYVAELETAKQEQEAMIAGRAIRIAIPNINEDDVIDYTDGKYHGTPSTAS